MKIAFVGVGSIAKRHIKNLTQILLQQKEDFVIDLYRHSVKVLEPELSGLVNRIYLDSEDINEAYDIVFITNPTSEHFETVKRWLPYAQNMFIEKPVFSDCENCSELLLKTEATYYVACPLRYSSALQYVKNKIDISKVFSVRAVCSSYLPDWRPGQDYRKVYSAHRDMGGGVSIDLIHEWDYLTWLFGSPNKIKSVISKVSSLEIDSDDIATYIGVYDDKVIELHLDYFGRKNMREVYLYTPEDTIKVDLTNSRIEYMKSGEIIELDENRDDMQKAELIHFLDIVNHKCENDNSISNAINTLRITRG